MKKLISFILLAAALNSFASEEFNSTRKFDLIGLDLGFNSYNSIEFNPYYEHLNDYENFVYRADFTYQNFKKQNIKFKHYKIGGLFGIASKVTVDGGGVNTLAGFNYYKYKSELDSEFAGLNIRGGWKYSAFVTKRFQFGATIMLNLQLGDLDCFYTTLNLEGAYYITPNLFTHIKFERSRIKIFDTSVVFAGIGYKFN